MSMRIITGSTGTTHVTSNDDGCYNQALWGKESIIFGVGEKLKATIIDNNTIEIADGDILLQGRHARINPNTTENVLINTGAVGVNRNDLIVARYTLDDSTGYEDISLVVIEGTESSGAAVDPEYTEGDIRTGAALVDFPLYRVKIEGINITDVELLAKVVGGIGGLKGEVDTINEGIEELKNSVSDGKAKVASAITSKGVSTATNATFDTMATNIINIETDVKHSVIAQAKCVSNRVYVRLLVDGNSIGEANHSTSTLATSGYTNMVAGTV